MKIIDSINRSINYSIAQIDHHIKKTANSPSATKKAFQIVLNAMALMDLKTVGKIQNREITIILRGTVELINLYASYKDIIFWVYPFSKDTLDQKRLKKSLRQELQSETGKENHPKTKELVQKILSEAMEGNFYSREELLEKLTIALEKNGFSHEKAEKIASHLILEQKSRSIAELFYNACFGIANLDGNIFSLKKWNLADLSAIAATLGKQSPILMFVLNLGADVSINSLVIGGYVVLVGEASAKTVIHAQTYFSTKDQFEREKAFHDLRLALLDLASGTADLVAIAAPLAFTLNPTTVITLALISKGTGLFCFLVK